MTDPGNVTLVVSDCDGVLTDGSLHLTPDRELFKQFHVHDGSAVKFLQEAGFTVCFLSGRTSKPLRKRADELDVADCVTGVSDKEQTCRDFAEQHDSTLNEVCYIGDDLTDLGAIKAAGFSATPSNGRPRIQEVVDYVTESAGGNGAFRDLAEFLLRRQDKWAKIRSSYA